MKIQTHLENLENYRSYLAIEEITHEFFRKRKYLRMDLPVLSPSLIPESYLEVFKTEFNYFQKKESLYLTPSPELFLKRLLTEGIGDCYYLGRAYRNSEPNSSWHLPEFTMLEFYKLGINYLEMADEVLGLLKFIKSRLSRPSFGMPGNKHNDINLKFDKWEKYTIAQAFEKFTGITHEELFEEKLLIEKAKNKGYQTKNATYEDLFSQIMANEIEPRLGRNGRATLLYDYPWELASLAKISADRKTAERCEFYINGLEIGGFCTELNNYKEQEKRFFSEQLKRKQSGLITHTIDKGFIEALKYGLPPVTGAGIGFERLAMTFIGTNSVSELKLISIQ